MIHAFLIVAALLWQTAKPDYDVRAAIVGRWSADKLSMIEAMPEYRGIEQEAARKAFKDAFLKSMPDTTFEFRETTFTLTLGANETVVDYRVTKVEGAQVLIRTTERANNGSVVEDEVEGEFMNQDTLTLMKKGERLAFRLKRVMP